MKQLRMEVLLQMVKKFIRVITNRVEEGNDYEQQISFYKKNYPLVNNLELLPHKSLVDAFMGLCYTN